MNESSFHNFLFKSPAKHIAFVLCLLVCKYAFGITENDSPIFTIDTAIHIVDTDNDGMPDSWEIANGLNPNVNDANIDTDGDGLTNIEEYDSGSNPQVFEKPDMAKGISPMFSISFVKTIADSDSDGMPNWWEIANGLNPLVNDSHLDPDGDGRTNLEEYNADSDPNVDDNKRLNCFSSINFTVNTDSYNGQYLDDSDSDGMPDWWEIRYGLQPTINDANGDEDKDGFTNLQEYNMGSNPLIPDTLIVSCYVEGKLFIVDTGGKYLDADNDGMPNWWERRFSGSTNGLVAENDSDGDGHTALQEFITRSKPDDSQSVFHISTVAEPNPENPDEWVISWDTTEERIYKVYSHTNLMTQWPTESIYQVEGDGTPKSYTNAKENIQFRFYRVSVEVMPHE